MERRTMSLEEECRYYDEQRQRINEWKELNAARLERKTLSDYIYSYEAEIQKMEEKGAPESLLKELRATRTELGTKLADAEDRIKRIEGLKTVNKNKSWPAQSILDRWMDEAEEDRLDAQTYFDMETSFLRRVQARVITWTGDLFGQIAAQIQIHARARSIHDIEKADDRITSLKEKMESIQARSASRLKFRRGLWAFRRAIGHRVGVEPAEGYMSPSERETYNEYSREIDDCYKAISAATRQKENAEKEIYSILRHRPDLMKQERYILLDEELQEDSEWYHELVMSQEKKPKGRTEDIPVKDPVTPPGPNAGKEKSPKTEPEKNPVSDPKKDPEPKTDPTRVNAGEDKTEKKVIANIPYQFKKSEDLSKRAIVGHGRMKGMDYFIERGARHSPRAYIRIPQGTGINGLCELRERPMDPTQKSPLKMPKEFKELFSNYVVETSQKTLNTDFKDAQNQGRFAVLEFKQKEPDGKWKRFTDKEIRDVITNAVDACDQFNAEHTEEHILAEAAVDVATSRIQKSCEVRDTLFYQLPGVASYVKDPDKTKSIVIQFNDGSPAFFINDTRASKEEVADVIKDPDRFVSRIFSTIDREEKKFWDTVRNRPESLPKDARYEWQAMLRETQDLFYNEEFSRIDAEMKGISFELSSGSEDKSNCYGLAFNNKGYPVFTLNGTDVTKAEFEEAVEKGPGLSPFKEAFQTALSDKKEQLIEMEKAKEREKNSPNKGRGE